MCIRDSIRNDEGYSFELDREARACIMSHNYEGNVRELHNCVEYLDVYKRQAPDGWTAAAVG